MRGSITYSSEFLTEKEQSMEKYWKSKRDSFSKYYKIKPQFAACESLFYRHGLIYVPDCVSDSIKGTVFIDAGAGAGDSAVAFYKYIIPSKIISFDISKKMAKEYMKTIKRNNMQYLCELVMAGVSDFEDHISFNDTQRTGTNIGCGGKDNIRITTIDKHVKDHNISRIGVIKMDVEGYCLPAIRGAIETIKRDRPVLLLGVYHNAEEFFGVKSFLNDVLPDYEWQFHKLCPFTLTEEATLIGYPKIK